MTPPTFSEILYLRTIELISTKFTYVLKHFENCLFAWFTVKLERMIFYTKPFGA